ncbi:hypothetical protein [Variovorax sp. DXTD-1]|uniref:hypothetical protein n=1 Tax=Variovorax sp. DXTD-1 TaxID=2495592 RepID=UPI0021AF087C|nr:hypothetical protein [Variovorax sp. DXTD-1]
MWLTQFDRGELSNEEVEAALVAGYEAKIAALERKVGELRKTRNLDVQDRFHNPCGAIFNSVFRSTDGDKGFGARRLTLKAESGRRVSIVVSASGRARVCNPDVRGEYGSGVCGSVGK